MNRDDIIMNELMGGSDKEKEYIIKIIDKITLKPESSYTTEIHNFINTLGIDPSQTRIFGSFSYKVQNSPADIDLIELIGFCCTRDEALKQMTEQMKEIIKKIQKTKGWYVGDIKAGLDERFLFNIGAYISGMLHDYYPKEIKENINKLYKDKALTTDQYKKLIDLVKPFKELTHEDFYELFLGLREFFIIRWKPKEILQGYKILSGNKKILLKDAINQKSIIKIDMWVPFQNRYIEVTNFYIVAEFNKKKHLQDIINLENDFFFKFEETLKRNIEDLYDHYRTTKSFKLVKRIYALGRIMKDYPVINKVIPLLRSDVGILYLVNSEIETIINMLKNIDKPPIENLIKQIENFKQRLSYVVQFKSDLFFEEEYDEIIDKIVDNYKIMSKDKIIEILSYLSNKLAHIINTVTINYMNAVELMPPPRKYFPKLLKYDIYDKNGKLYEITQKEINKFNKIGKSQRFDPKNPIMHEEITHPPKIIKNYNPKLNYNKDSRRNKK